MNPSQKSQKFRPYFTASELSLLISSLKSTTPFTPAHASLARYLEEFSLKISRGILAPQLTLAPSIEEKLEIGVFENPKRRIGDMRKAAYKKFTAASSNCTAEEIEMAHLFRYENDLMSPEEMVEYERQAFGQGTGN